MRSAPQGSALCHPQLLRLPPCATRPRAADAAAADTAEPRIVPSRSGKRRARASEGGLGSPPHALRFGEGGNQACWDGVYVFEAGGAQPGPGRAGKGQAEAGPGASQGRSAAPAPEAPVGPSVSP